MSDLKLYDPISANVVPDLPQQVRWQAPVAFWTAVFERDDGSTFEQPYEHLEELVRLVKEYKGCLTYLVDIY